MKTIIIVTGGYEVTTVPLAWHDFIASKAKEVCLYGHKDNQLLWMK